MNISVFIYSGTSEIRPPSGPFKVVLILRNIIHVYMDLGLNQSGLISKLVTL